MARARGAGLRPPYRRAEAGEASTARPARRLAALLLAATASALPFAAAGEPAGADAGAPALSPCRVPGMAHALQCGSVRRPLDPAQPAGPAIDVRFAVVPALARRKWPDPVLLFAGGPGQSAIDIAARVMPLFTRLNNRRDIVFIDQRGTGRSAPLNCDDPTRTPLAEAGDPDAQARQMQRCRTQLQRLRYAAAPGALGHFTTWVATQDADAVRERLGAERVDLVGVSYGTRAALDYQRQFPRRVRRSVLDGVAPPDMGLPTASSADSQAALDALFAACEHEPRCAADHPRLRTDWQALLGSLPREVTVAQPLTGVPERFVLRRDMLLAAVRAPLYVPALAAALPAAIAAAADPVRPRFEPLSALGTALQSRGPGGVAIGMHFSVVCSEDAASAPPAPGASGGAGLTGADFGRGLEQLYQRVCADWPRGPVPAAFYTVPVAQSPVLLLSGGLDPATPPRHGARVARALGAKALHVVVPNGGHGLLGSACGPELLWRFIDAADDAQALALDTACLSAVPRPPAFVPPGATAAAAAAR